MCILVALSFTDCFHLFISSILFFCRGLITDEYKKTFGTYLIFFNADLIDETFEISHFKILKLINLFFNILIIFLCFDGFLLTHIHLHVAPEEPLS